MVYYCSAAKEFFSVDGKPQHTYRPVKGKSTSETMRQLDESNANLVQNSY